MNRGREITATNSSTILRSVWWREFLFKFKLRLKKAWAGKWETVAMRFRREAQSQTCRRQKPEWAGAGVRGPSILRGSVFCADPSRFTVLETARISSPPPCRTRSLLFGARPGPQKSGSLTSQSPIWQRPGLGITASSFKPRANAPEGRKAIQQFPINRKAISYQLLSTGKQFPINFLSTGKQFPINSYQPESNFLSTPGPIASC
jgi:hypothetical protein